LIGNGCPKCGGMEKKNTEIFLSLAKAKHNDLYGYSLVNYVNCYSKIDIICKKHGIFKQMPRAHYLGSGCPRCNDSHGEKMINDFLNESKIKFEREKRFKNCRLKMPLPFDFYLPDFNVCIEYDGIQHFKPIKYWGNKFELTKKRDSVKNDFCNDNNIKLLRIPYTQNKIEIEENIKKFLR